MTKVLAILFVVLFVVTVTAGAVSANGGVVKVSNSVASGAGYGLAYPPINYGGYGGYGDVFGGSKT